MDSERVKILKQAVRALEVLDNVRADKQKELAEQKNWAEVSRIQQIREGVRLSKNAIQKLIDNQVEVLW